MMDVTLVVIVLTSYITYTKVIIITRLSLWNNNNNQNFSWMFLTKNGLVLENTYFFKLRETFAAVVLLYSHYIWLDGLIFFGDLITLEVEERCDEVNSIRNVRPSRKSCYIEKGEQKSFVIWLKFCHSRIWGNHKQRWGQE